MTAVEEVQAAIDKLTKLRSESKPGPWTDTWGSATVPAADDLAGEDAELIIALHGTIDAQLAIFEDFAYRYRTAWAHWIPAGPGAGNTLALARAINGPA